MKPVKLCIENPDYPISTVFAEHNWELSGGTKQIGVLSAAIILSFNIDTVIEIGLFHGFSSGILAKALASNTDNGFLLSVDILNRGISRSKKATEGIPITHKHVLSDSLLVDYKKELDGRIPGMAFVDGAHDYEHAAYDIDTCSKLIKKWGFLIVHDYSSGGHPFVYQAVNEFVEKTKWPMFYQNENRESTDYRSAIIQKV